MMTSSKDECAVCFRSKNNEIFVVCCMCGLGVHGTCYGCSFTANSRSKSEWKCRYCNAICVGKVNDYTNKINKAIKCRICNQCKFGALKSCGKKQGFAHLVCALWTPWTFIENTYNMAPIKGIDKCKKYKSVLKNFICSLCNKSHATIKCRVKCCSEYFHPLCLIEKHRNCMIEGNGIIDGFQCKIYHVYCPQHVQSHKSWNQKEGHKKPKSREVVFESRDSNTHSGDISMVEVDNNDTDSDIIILNGKKFECESNKNNDVQNDSSAPNQRNPVTPATQILSPFISRDSATPVPSMQMDIASQWTERLQNACMSDRDSIYGFNHNSQLREYSPLTIGNNVRQMTPNSTFNEKIFNNENTPDCNFNCYPNWHNFSAALNVNKVSERNINSMQMNLNEQKLSNDIPSKSASLGAVGTVVTVSTNSTFGTISPQAIASHGSVSNSPCNGEQFQFKDGIDVDVTCGNI